MVFAVSQNYEALVFHFEVARVDNSHDKEQCIMVALEGIMDGWFALEDSFNKICFRLGTNA